MEAVGCPDLRGVYAGFIDSMPSEWYACYTGLFPGRDVAGAGPWVRVECIVGDGCQRAYSRDAGALRERLARVGIRDADALGAGLADGRCALLPQTVFAKRAERGGESATITCFPAFVKLRWHPKGTLSGSSSPRAREGRPADAKAYLLVRVRKERD